MYILSGQIVVVIHLYNNYRDRLACSLARHIVVGVNETGSFMIESLVTVFV